MKNTIDAWFENAGAFIAAWYGRIYAVCAFILGVFIAWHVLSLATPLGIFQILLVILCLAGLSVGLWMRGGEMRLLNVLATLGMYAGGFAAALAIYDTIQGDDTAIAEWQVWLIFTGIFLALYRGFMVWFAPTKRLEGMTDDERAEYLAVRSADARRKAELKSLPSHGWYQIASFVTGAAMVGSFATTAIGFHHEIVDPLDPPLVQYGIPIGLSALAALIIWAGWNFVFLRIRLASNMFSRLFGFVAGLIVLVPLTLAIHTVFGIIGVGGTEGIRAHNLWYADVLDAYERRVDGVRAIEANRLSGALQYMSNQLKAAAASEETTGQGCGAGKGSLWTFYTDSAARTATILDIVTTRKNANQDLKSEIEALRARIRKPEGKLEDIQPELAAQADQIRRKIVETDNSSALPSVKTFVKETSATVNSDAFFSGWSACTLAKKDVILTQINTLVASVDDAAESAEADIAVKKSSLEFRIPVENRIETIPFIDRYFHGERAAAVPTLEQQAQSADSVPVFVPLRPFWAVVSYAGSLMGYVALQLALDFSPAVLGLLFALLAPFPNSRTRLGKAWDSFWAKRFEKWTPADEEPEVPAPAKAAPQPKAAPQAKVMEDERPAEVEEHFPVMEPEDVYRPQAPDADSTPPQHRKEPEFGDAPEHEEVTAQDTGREPRFER
ncbi:hypothetical protein JJB09_00385 [Rhizobium sp. KVB221]|uniref:Uncharacterized protein n=1 Tax=Rhizobium setariae TaxID=2801340 RepID=A0A936YKL7_9HYPH|nr:hypothetical protein [Rhizobium setariae]MBL0370472.1 hypothetical protein [Rhizobium setariae]